MELVYINISNHLIIH